MTDEHIRRERATKKAARNLVRRRRRLEARLGPEGAAAFDRKRVENKRMRYAENLVLQQACMKRELKRARTTPIDPRQFRTIELLDEGNDDDDDGDESLYDSDQISHDEYIETGAGSRIFAGQVVIQHRLDASDKLFPSIPEMAHGERSRVATRFMSTPLYRYWASPWTAHGYRIQQFLDQTDAELWAIWQGLEVTLEKVHADKMYVKPEDPCAVMVIYSDCAVALRNIDGDMPGGARVVQKIISQSMELQSLGVEVQLHWVPGHRQIPGNELADLVSKRARKPVKEHLGTRQRPSLDPLTLIIPADSQ